MTKREAKPAVATVKELLLQSPDGLREVARAVLQEVLEVETNDALGAENGERTPDRLGYRAGYYPRTLVTRVGKLDCDPAPFILGVLLGPLLETNMRRSLLLSSGDFSTFVTNPISAAFLLAAVGLIALIVMPAIRRRKDEAVVHDE